LPEKSPKTQKNGRGKSDREWGPINLEVEQPRITRPAKLSNQESVGNDSSNSNNHDENNDGDNDNDVEKFYQPTKWKGLSSRVLS
jgi:hypothetical protein